MKTTPFGTFTAVIPGRFADAGEAGGGGRPRLIGDPRAKRSLVRLNKRIYTRLREELLADPEVRRRLGVELNPTLHLDGGGAAARWRFLTDRGGREVFQRLARNPVLDLYQRMLAAGPRPLGELIAAIAGRSGVDAGADEVAAYSDRLIEIGFLELRFGVSPRCHQKCG